MRNLSSLMVLLLLLTQAFGQSINRHEADSMISVLNKTKIDAHRIDLMLRLAQFHILKPGEYKIDFDSAISLMNEANRLNNISVKSQALNGYRLFTESFMLKETGKREEAKKILEKAISILEPAGNKYYLGKACYELSTYYDYSNSNEYSVKVRLVEQSVDAFQESGNLLEKAFSMKMLGDLYGNHDEFEKALAILRQALEVYDSIHYKELQGVYALMGDIYWIQNEYAQAIKYELLALQSAEAVHDSTMQLGAIYNSLGTLYSDIGRKEVAIKYYRGALKIAIRCRDTRAVSLALYNISTSCRTAGQPWLALDMLATVPKEILDAANARDKAFIGLTYLNTYLATKQFNKTSGYCDMLLKLVDDPIISDRTKNIIYRSVASHYIGNGQWEKARFYLSKNIPILKKLPESLRVATDSKYWYRIDSAQGNFRSAFFHLHRFKLINDSLFNLTKTRQFQQLELEYETAKKADSIKLKNQDISFLTQKNNLQQANLKQANLIKNFTIAGIILAVVMIVLLYRQYRGKQQSNKLISSKNEQLQRLVTEKEWLLKEVHHRVKNNLQTVVSLLELQPDSLQNEALSAVRDSRNRVYAMSLIHQKLYQTDNIASVNMRAYLVELVNHLQEVYNTERRIQVNVRVMPVELDVSQAIPAGLIVNEAVTNCIKYAFETNQSNPEITVSLQENKSGQAELTIADNGKGLPETFDNATINGFGFRIMKGLAEDIEGKFTVISDNGVCISVHFHANIPFNAISAETVSEKPSLV